MYMAITDSMIIAKMSNAIILDKIITATKRVDVVILVDAFVADISVILMTFVDIPGSLVRTRHPYKYYVVNNKAS